MAHFFKYILVWFSTFHKNYLRGWLQASLQVAKQVECRACTQKVQQSKRDAQRLCRAGAPLRVLPHQPGGAQGKSCLLLNPEG